MLKRSPLFVPILQHNPQFETLYNKLLAHDRYSAFAYNGCLQYKMAETHCVVKRDPVTGLDTSHLMLFPFHVTMASTNVFGTLHGGMLMTLVDMCTSFHIGERLLPKMPGHVSVNLSTSFITAAKRDDRVIAACRVDKLGKKLVYTSVDFLLDASHHHGRLHRPSPPPSAQAALTREGSDIAGDTTKPADPGIDEIERILKEYTVVASGKHVKSILPKVDLHDM